MHDTSCSTFTLRSVVHVPIRQVILFIIYFKFSPTNFFFLSGEYMPSADFIATHRKLDWEDSAVLCKMVWHFSQLKIKDVIQLVWNESPAMQGNIYCNDSMILFYFKLFIQVDFRYHIIPR